MSDRFAIGNTQSELELGEDRGASLEFNVVNPGGTDRIGRLIARPGQGVEADWLRFEGPDLRAIGAGQTETVVVSVVFPEAVAPGDYEFHLECADPEDTQRTQGAGRPVKVTVPEPVIVDEVEEKEEERWNWKWLIPVIVVVAVLAGLVGWIVSEGRSSARDIIEQHLDKRVPREEFATMTVNLKTTEEGVTNEQPQRDYSMLRHETDDGALRARFGRVDSTRIREFLAQEPGGMPVCAIVNYEDGTGRVTGKIRGALLFAGIPCTVFGIEPPRHYEYEFGEEEDQVWIVKATHTGSRPPGLLAPERKLWIRKSDHQKIREQSVVAAGPVKVSTDAQLEYDDDRLSGVKASWEASQDGRTLVNGEATISFGQYEARDISDDELEIPE